MIAFGKGTHFYNILLISSLIFSISPNNSITSMPNGVSPKISAQKELGPLPNVIYFVGDGMGPEHIKAASLVEYGSPNASIMDTDFPIQYLYSTRTASGYITDSSAAGTALSTGQLVETNTVAMDITSEHFVKTILEYLQFDFGYTTGFVTTTEFTHATPASFTVHINDRDETIKIRDFMLSKGMDVILGGGLGLIYVNNKEQAYDLGDLYNYEVATDVNELQTKAKIANKLFGVFPHIGLPFEMERDLEIHPSIVQMADAAFEVLRRKNSPYFLMIEGGNIDHAAHYLLSENKTLRNVMETIMFEKTVRLALEIAKTDGNTIVVVTADHETGGLQVIDYSNMGDTLPSESNTRDQNNIIRNERTQNLVVNWLTVSHTDIPVKFFGYGSDFGNYSITKINDVFWAINQALGSFPAIHDHTFTQIGSSLKITAKIMDVDQSATDLTVFVKYANSTTKTFDFILNTSNILNYYTFEVPIDSSQSYNAYFQVHDGGINDINSFDINNKLVQQDIKYLQPSHSETSMIQSTTTQTSTTQTSSKKTQLSSISIILGLPVLIIVLHKKNRFT